MYIHFILCKVLVYKGFNFIDYSKQKEKFMTSQWVLEIPLAWDLHDKILNSQHSQVTSLRKLRAYQTSWRACCGRFTWDPSRCQPSIADQQKTQALKLIYQFTSVKWTLIRAGSHGVPSFKCQVTWGQSMQFQTLRPWKLGLSHVTWIPTPNYNMNAYIATLFGGEARDLLKVGSSKKARPNSQPNFHKYFYIK